MWPGLLGGAVAALLFADSRGSRPGVWLAKPLASSVFVAAALAWGAAGSGYGRWLLVALALSGLGDVLLIPDEPRVLRPGVEAVARAHVAYVAALAARCADLARIALALPLVIAALFIAARWLRPHVPADMKLSVNAYMLIISAMVVAAAGASRADPRILAGALLFY